MKKIFAVLIVTVVVNLTFSQIIESSCVTSDSIRQTYLEDAERMTIRKMYRQNLVYIDSIKIPQSHSDSILNALIAVYNATTLPARDTVVNMFSIHTFTNPITRNISIAADSTLPWMQQLETGNIPTGNEFIDSLISEYSLSIQSYDYFSNAFPWHTVVLTSVNNLNLPPLATKFAEIDGVYFSQPDSYYGDGNDISDSIYTDHIELIYSYGWGDCPSGCKARRFWKFNVYDDCSVEFIESFGTQLPFNGQKEDNNRQISLSPNPFKDKITVKGIDKEFNYTLTNVNGKIILEGTSNNDSIEIKNDLSESLYFLTIQKNGQKRTFKLLLEK